MHIYCCRMTQGPEAVQECSSLLHELYFFNQVPVLLCTPTLNDFGMINEKGDQI